MFLHYRTKLTVLSFALALPWAAQVLAEDAPAPAAESPAKPAVERQALVPRSDAESQALERQLPSAEQQKLQAGGDEFLALWKPANTAEASGAVIIVPGKGESADWPNVVGPLRRKLPNAGWSTLSLTLPDPVGMSPPQRAPQGVPEPAQAPAKATPPDANASVEQATSSEAPDAPPPPSAADTPEEQDTADAERIFARIEAAIAFAQQQQARTIVLVGHGTGAYWANRYQSERQSPHVRKVGMVDVRKPNANSPQVSELTAKLRVPVADLFHDDTPIEQRQARDRLDASKRQKGVDYRQITLKTVPGDTRFEDEQVYRRVRGWLSPPTDE